MKSMEIRFMLLSVGQGLALLGVMAKGFHWI
jgi:hypothetical protein